MIRIIDSPQRSDIVISHTIEDEVLSVTVNGMTEEFDFTGLPEGQADEITPELLRVNPIVSAEKVGDEVTITLIRFYGEDEKEVFEIGKKSNGKLKKKRTKTKRNKKNTKGKKLRTCLQTRKMSSWRQSPAISVTYK